MQLRLPLLFKSSSRGRLCVFVAGAFKFFYFTYVYRLESDDLRACVCGVLLEVRRGYLIPGTGIAGACQVLDMGAWN